MDALSVCAETDAPPWGEECYFLVVDGLQLQGGTALELCESAGRWAYQCKGHAIGRAAEEAWRRLGPGREPEIAREVLAIHAAAVGGREAGRRSRRWMVARIAARDLHSPFSAETCGAAPEELCRDAYVERVKVVTGSVVTGSVVTGSVVTGSVVTGSVVKGRVDGGEPWRRACGRSVSRQRATTLGMPDWTDEMDPVVQTAWRELCRR